MARVIKAMGGMGKMSPRIIEFRCEHGYSSSLSIRANGYGFSLYMCDKCFSNLVTLIDQVLLETKDADLPHKFSPLGLYCDRHEGWFVGGAYLISRIGMRKEVKLVDGVEKENFVFKRGRVITNCYCENCWREINRMRVIVSTRSNVFIEDGRDGTINALFEQRLEKTDKIFSLIPTELLRSIIAELPSEKRKEIEALEYKEDSRGI